MYAQWIESYQEYVSIHHRAPSLREFQRTHNVSQFVAKKISAYVNGTTKELHATRKYCKGYGSCSLSEEEEDFLLGMYRIDPTSTLAQYKHLLFLFNGKVVHESTICRWFKYSMEHKSSKKKTSVFPHKKFTYHNLIKINNYINFVSHVSPFRLIFTDEKSLRGSEMYNTGTRRDPVTGRTPPTKSTLSNLKIKFNIMAAIKINGQERENIFYQVGKYKSDSNMFNNFVLNISFLLVR